MRTRRAASLAAGAALTAALAGCAEPHPTLGDLKAIPGATSTYPGALTYGHREEHAAHKVDPTSAMIQTDACTHDTPAQVQAWFGQHLTAQGWTLVPGSHQQNDGSLVGGAQWKHPNAQQGNAYLDLWFATPATADELARMGHQPTGCPTVYETLAVG